MQALHRDQTPNRRVVTWRVGCTTWHHRSLTKATDTIRRCFLDGVPPERLLLHPPHGTVTTPQLACNQRAPNCGRWYLRQAPSSCSPQGPETTSHQGLPCAHPHLPRLLPELPARDCGQRAAMSLKRSKHGGIPKNYQGKLEVCLAEKKAAIASGQHVNSLQSGTGGGRSGYTATSATGSSMATKYR